MKKAQYLKRVERLLPLPAARRKEVLRDLEELFDSAAEHGESENELMERLGSPREFAAGYGDPSRRRRLCAGAAAAAVLAAGCLLLLLAGWLPRALFHLETAVSSVGIIGGADGPTQIYVSSSASFPWGWFLGAAAVCCLLAAGILFRKWRK